MQKHSGSELSGLKSAELPDVRHARLPEKSHTRECKTYQDAWDESRRTAAAEEANREVAAGPVARPLNPSSSSTDPRAEEDETDH